MCYCYTKVITFLISELFKDLFIFADKAFHFLNYPSDLKNVLRTKMFDTILGILLHVLEDNMRLHQINLRGPSLFLLDAV